MSKQKKGSFFRDVIVVGFALFSMFFGAGNVIFPPYLGMESGSSGWRAFPAYYIADIRPGPAGYVCSAAGGQQRGGAASRRSVPAEILMCAIICAWPMVATPAPPQHL